ncbi:MAG: 6-bladed beta-propeller [Gemmatimonadota bacterium]|nr:6-bladed beta-propeller [Gemmatimonadota bacterium]MDE2871111.1 6-bladed beta-propeller [Gemmatimonadota bacterium]
MWFIPARPAVAAALFLTAAACADGDGREDPGVPREVPTLEGTIDLEIGRLDGDDPFLFSYILDVAADEQGRVIVADRDATEIRVFEPDGGFAFLFGGPGEGPGEFTDICCMEFGPDGELWVRESQRYSVFRLGAAGAEYRRGLRSPNMGVIGVREPFTFDQDGHLVAVGPVHVDDGPSLDARFRVLPDGVADTVIMADAERQFASQTTVPFNRAGISGFMYMHRPFGSQWHHAHANGGAWAEALTGVYSINYHHPDGTVSAIEGPALQGPPLTEDDRVRAQGWMDRQIERAGVDRHPFDIPDHKPPLSQMFFDRAGRLWIVRTMAEGATMREADVWNGTTLVARYRWPRRIRELPTPWATESTLYGVTTDSLDVQRVARVRFRTR